MRRLIEAIEAIVEAAVGSRLDYHALYPCSVATQASDGTLDLIPDDARIKGSGTSGIKIRNGLPGVEVEVPDGTRVLMGFEAGDPKRPYAALWDSGDVDTINMGSALGTVIREGDVITLTDGSTGIVTITTGIINPSLVPPAPEVSKVKA